MALYNATNVYSNSRYIVDNVAPGAAYTTVQSAINAAQAAGGAASVWVRQGTYTENLTLYDGINIEGQEQTLSVIIGTHVPPVAGAFTFNRIGLQSGTHIFSSAAAGAAALSCTRCRFNTTNGYVFNLANWTGTLNVRFCTDISTANGLVNNAGGSIVNMNHSLVGVGANVFTANGNISIFSCSIGCPILANGTGVSLFNGASNFTGNIATANTHNLTIAQCRVDTGAATAITHASATLLVLDSTILRSSNATAVGGTGSIKQVMVEYPLSSVIAGTITETVDGVTRTGELWANNITRMDDTGFYSWAAGGPYFDDATLGTFKLLVGGTGYIRNRKVTWVAQSITGLAAGNCYFIYIDATGTIGKASSRTDALFLDNIVLFECLRDSTAGTNIQYTVKENHPYDHQAQVSNYEHAVIGCIIGNNSNGANITLVGTQGIGIVGADVLEDHGLDTTIPDSGGAAVTWNRMLTNAGGKWITQNSTNAFTGYWNNGGTATALTAGRYGIYRLYVSKDTLNATTPTYWAVLNTAEYANLTAAQTAIANDTASKISGELAALEMAQLGTIIYRQSTAAIVQVNISKATLRGTTSTGSVGTASLVTTVTTGFNGILSSADTNVQSALDTIDDWGAGATLYGVLIGRGVNTAIQAAAPSATLGVPLVSAGASANPAFGTAVVAGGGTGVVSMTTAYAPVCAGTSATGALQVASTGLSTSGYVLTSNGNAALPSFQAAASGSTLTIKGLVVGDSPYTTAAGDQYISANTTSGAITVKLPNAPTTGRVYYVKDFAGTAAASNITITTVGGAVNIDGAATFVMSSAYQAASLVFSGSVYEIF